ncbi:MAG TPA: M1 family aminopeptidase [Gemmatimonadales bacterium]|nr:M1 family aminopeptidase [Gemmatimonadales bacterium]
MIQYSPARPRRISRVALQFAFLCVVSASLEAQQVPLQSPALSYQQGYDEFRGLRPRTDRVAEVHDLVLQREGGRFTLEEGSLALLSSVSGRTVGAAFKGRGTFSFVPRTRIEREQLRRVEKRPELDAPFTELVLLFSDGTLAELEGKLRFGASSPAGGIGSLISQAIEYLGDPESHTPDPDVMLDLLNANSGGMFYAHIDRKSGSPLMFMINPHQTEGVVLLHRARSVGWARMTEVAAQERPAADSLSVPLGDRTGDALVKHYKIDATLAKAGSGDLNFSASALMYITARSSVGPWVAFWLFDKLIVDSARWSDGSAATVHKGKDSPYFWLRLPNRLDPGQAQLLTLFYHGNLIDRYGDFFFINSSSAWYPRPLEGRSLATFELTYHSPAHYLFASVGERMDTATVDRMTTSRWVTSGPIRNASFNLGLFEDYETSLPGTPPVTVLVSEQGHRLFYRAGPGAKAYAREDVGDDVAKSMKFFQHVFGVALADRFYATEIPYLHGEAFPGLVQLSYATFVQSDKQGFDEVFRAHEVAHQWWGIGVDFTTYHDQWLSEGFSSFAGLWYLQTNRGKPKQYFDILDLWKADLMVRRADLPPLWLGYRVGSADFPNDYQYAVYQKGAWVLHMLRALMIDLKTMNEDRFTGMMRDFYATYRGKRASTEDFRHVVERHTGADMGWFFDQWVYRSEIPTYRYAWQAVPVEGGKFRVRLRVRQEQVPDEFQMYVPVTVELGKDSWARARVKIKGPLTEVELPVLLPTAPKSVRFNDLQGVLADVKSMAWED